ncbi:pilus assembly protein [Pseudocitrobacter cyperus]|uniref:Pilus assembly protein n=1 Tax=Pseudocitrobacter cyperus TaxID=3112843 RepID=A0ABV0HNJ3_9ENTR
MAFGCWQIGLHIQQDKIAALALQRVRGGWALRRWWLLPLPADFSSLSPPQTENALVATLSPWRRELPWQHAVSLAFPANRTLQKTLPQAAMTLRDSEQAQWIASAMAQQVAMEPGALCFDYQQSPQADGWSVTAARRKDVEQLQRVARALRLQVTAVTPDASALRQFLPWLSAEWNGLAWHDANQWLWANATGWGSAELEQTPSLSHLEARLATTGLVQCTTHVGGAICFDPWSVIGQKYPPLPGEGDDFAVAIALALGAQA